jgi:hypothetical protein
VPVQRHWRIEPPHNLFGRMFRLKLGRKVSRGLSLGGSAAAIYSHSQERRDLFVLGHALSLGRRADTAFRRGRNEKRGCQNDSLFKFQWRVLHNYGRAERLPN